jgi:hypothetical protein
MMIFFIFPQCCWLLSVHTVRICVLKLNEASDMNKPCLIKMPNVTSVQKGFDYTESNT